MDEDLAGAAVILALVARHPHAQLQRMPDHRHVADAALDAVAVDPDRPAPPGTTQGVDGQVALQHRGLTVQSGVGDPHPELDGTDDRDCHDLNRRERIINFSWPAPQRSDTTPLRRPLMSSPALRSWKAGFARHIRYQNAVRHVRYRDSVSCPPSPPGEHGASVRGPVQLSS
ncbi:hypothetical protein GCM10023175_52660 [Pseudonocardia xishanensis]|uniref:Uncharacterized protein n=1 Tax=Pseudonocardia xishanensis TaxID=630995 RepID=A0ABP8S0C1_9PSEU